MAAIQGFLTTVQFAVLALALTAYLSVKTGSPLFEAEPSVAPAFESSSKTPRGFV